MRLRLRGREAELLVGAPLIMGIVNLGRDSVADDAATASPEAAVRRAETQAAAGARIIDIGVQSGRTDTAVISEADETARLVPVVERVAATGLAVSVDTWRPAVAAAAIDAGASMINDTSGLADVELADIAAASGAALVLMHTRARPKEEFYPGYADPMADVLTFLTERLATAREHGVLDEQLVVDPGPDFSKTPAETVAVLRALPELRRFGRPILLAVSRKYFIGMITGRGPKERLAGTLAAVEHGVEAGAHIVRVHDVADVAEFLSLRFALHGTDDPPIKGDPRSEGLKWLPAAVRDPTPEESVDASPPPGMEISSDAETALVCRIADALDTTVEAAQAFVAARETRYYSISEMFARLRELGRSTTGAPASTVVRRALLARHPAEELSSLDAALANLDEHWSGRGSAPPGTD